MHRRVVDALRHLPEPVLVVAHLRERAREEIERLRRMIEARAVDDLDLARGGDVLVRVYADLLRDPAVFFLVERLREHLAAEDGADLFAVEHDGRGEVHEARVALVDLRASLARGFRAVLGVAFLAARLALGAAARVLHAEVRPVRRMRDRRAVEVDGHGRHADRPREIILEFLDEVHVKNILQANFLLCHKAYLLQWSSFLSRFTDSPSRFLSA